LWNFSLSSGIVDNRRAEKMMIQALGGAIVLCLIFNGPGPGACG
jgi:hypothetical protein